GCAAVTSPEFDPLPLQDTTLPAGEYSSARYSASSAFFRSAAFSWLAELPRRPLPSGVNRLVSGFCAAEPPPSEPSPIPLPVVVPQADNASATANIVEATETG